MDLHRTYAFIHSFWYFYVFVSLTFTVYASSKEGIGQHVKTAGFTQPPQGDAKPAEPLQPDDKPNQPDAQPVQPDAQPNQPDTQMVQPDTQPNQPDAQTVQPDAQPTKPEAQPNEPDAKPAEASSSPSSSSTNYRKPGTPPPPPMEYSKGEPQQIKDFFEQTFGDQRLQFFDNGTTKLSMDQYSGSGFKSKDEFLYITMTIKMKLIPDNSAGAVTTFYLTSSGFGHDEIDIEFLGNSTGEPPTMHTNVYVDGKGNREQQFHLWFDPTADFHAYTLSWNSKRIAWYVDGIPIRQYRSNRENGVPYPTNKAQRIIASLWNADDWCTQGGKVKADWSKAPFVAYYKDFTTGFCQWRNGGSTCGVNPTSSIDPKFDWLNEEFDQKGLDNIKWAQDNLMIYNYCNDKARFPEGLPKECTLFH